MQTAEHSSIVEIPSKWWFGFTGILTLLVGFFAWSDIFMPRANLLGTEVFLLVIALFIFGSIKYRIDKNVLTYGALPLIIISFFPIWFPGSALEHEIHEIGLFSALWHAAQEHIFTLHGLEELIHADIMLFILGLTFFVSVISQTRLLETLAIRIVRIFEGNVLLSLLVLSAIVSFASGILDGVSMIGLTIRVFVIILVMAKIQHQNLKFVVMISVILTTVAGMWLAYGEPPNLIMKSNLGLSDGFFLRHTAPLAIATYIVAAYFLYRRFKGKRMALSTMDVLEQNTPDIKFLQTSRHGETKDIEEVLGAHDPRFGDKSKRVHELYHQGHHPISAMIRAGVDETIIDSFITEYLGKEFVGSVTDYYKYRIAKEDASLSEEKREDAQQAELQEADAIERLLQNAGIQRRATQTWAKIAFIPFVALLIWHAQNHNVPLFIASTAGFAVAALGILPHTKIRKLAFKEASHEYKEYLFLLPLFLSITMLTAVGFFDQLQAGIERGVAVLGEAHMATAQFVGAGLLSALLDNNVVADFASRAIDGMPAMFLFAAAQIAGYAAGGALTHIGSAQSVVAFAYILRYLDPKFTPLEWIQSMAKVVVSISIVLIIGIYILALLA